MGLLSDDPFTFDADAFGTGTPAHFYSGVELTPADHARLGQQILRVRDVLSDGRWWSVPGIQREIWQRFRVRDPEPSLSAQIRNLKKVEHGSHVIERKRDGNVWLFRWVKE
jgi:hypothetical protein